MFSFFKKKKIVPHIKLNGVIGNVGKFKQGIDFSGQEEIIEKAFSLKKISAVAVSINSPGGSPVQSHLIYKFIRELAKKNNKKVIVFAEDVAASGGYLIACAGDEIYANASSIIGSIGVIYSSFGFKELIKKIGVDTSVVPVNHMSFPTIAERPMFSAMASEKNTCGRPWEEALSDFLGSID